MPPVGFRYSYSAVATVISVYFLYNTLERSPSWNPLVDRRRKKFLAGYKTRIFITVLRTIHLLMLVPLPWKWRRCFPPKRRFTHYLLGAKSQKMTFFIVTAVKTSDLTYFSTDRTDNTSPNSFIVASHSYRMDRVENTVFQLLHWCVLRICCRHYLATVVL
jgi:hypothetical protein